MRIRQVAVSGLEAHEYDLQKQWRTWSADVSSNRRCDTPRLGFGGFARQQQTLPSRSCDLNSARRMSISSVVPLLGLFIAVEELINHPPHTYPGMAKDTIN